LRKLLISGIAPGPGGVGEFMTQIEAVANPNIWDIKYPKQFKGRNNIFIKIINEIFIKFFFSISKTNIKLYDEIVIISFAHLNIRLLNKIKLLAKKVVVYHIDNSFFCVKAYNHLPGNNKPCLKCLDSLNFSSEYSCTPRPFNFSKNQPVSKINIIKLMPKVTFLALSQGHKKLIKKFYGNYSDVTVLSHYTKELDDLKITQKNSDKYDLVYHGSDMEEKGSHYIIKLFSELSEYKCLVPFKLKSHPENINAKDMTWNSGLGDAVSKARVVFCPSLWTATPETSILKSLINPGLVAAFDFENSFSHELPDNTIIKLTGNIISDAEIIRNILSSTTEQEIRIKESKSFVKEHLGKAKLNLISYFE
jgi:hypothetical protein